MPTRLSQASWHMSWLIGRPLLRYASDENKTKLITVKKACNSATLCVRSVLFLQGCGFQPTRLLCSRHQRHKPDMPLMHSLTNSLTMVGELFAQLEPPWRILTQERNITLVSIACSTSNLSDVNAYKHPQQLYM